ncbi:MAG: efflux RND transporter periplasmic adaptor subunit [Candidatus Hydrogenedentota bacterium]
MSSNSEARHHSQPNLKKRTAQIGAAVLAVVVAVFWLTQPGETALDATTFEAERGLLRISVTEGGEAESTEAQEIRSEVQGMTTILDIVEEGYRVTEEDIENELTLVELDSSELEDDLTQQQIEYENDLASLTEAQEQHAITLSQNESDIHDAELNLKFAEMDVHEYLGQELGQEVLAEVREDQDSDFLAAASGGNPGSGGNPAADTGAGETDGEELDLEDIDVEDLDSDESLPIPEDFDSEGPQFEMDLEYQSLLDDDRLGGSAQQTLRDLESEITMAEEELSQDETEYEWTMELADEGFVTSDQEEQDRLTLQRSDIDLQSRETERELFVNYEFPQELEDLVSQYQQAHRELDRTRRRAAAETAQAEAQLRSRKARYDMQEERVEELEEQIEACVITAEREGLVVYATGNGRGGNDDLIEEGTEVRERQEILTIPDMNNMAVEVEVHEAEVNHLAEGQPARIIVDAYSDEVLTGEVTRVALVPDSGHRWLNPDLRLFPTTVSIDGSYEWFRPGMTAEVEIIVNELEDVVYVPMQAVISYGEQRYVYVVENGQAAARPVETGDYNDRFIHIKEGLEEGEEVLLRPPRPDGAEEDEEDPEEEQESDPMDMQEEAPGGGGGLAAV